MNIGISAARTAGNIILQGFERLDKVAVSEKQQNDYVTEIDIKAENAIIHTIHKAYPDHEILAEESGRTGNSDIVWIVDPLDGTRNFMHGLPHFAVSIAIEENKKMTHAIIYDPMRDELFTASRGIGAQLNNRRLRVSQQTELRRALVGTGFPIQEENVDGYLPTFSTLLAKCGGMRRAGAAALDLAYVAASRLDGFWEFNLHPWDIAAGSLLIKEAGGLISDFHGGEDYLTSGNVVAGNPRIFKLLLQNIKPLAD